MRGETESGGGNYSVTGGFAGAGRSTLTGGGEVGGWRRLGKAFLSCSGLVMAVVDCVKSYS